jgi:hypothetical protein
MRIAVKLHKILILVSLGILIVLAIAILRPVTHLSPNVADTLSSEFTESCLLPTVRQRPVWECYEITISVPEHQEIIIQHPSGEQHKVLTFRDQNQTKFRFTPTQQGTWTFSTGGEIKINADRPDYAKGFVAAQNSKWIRTATGKAFVPQFVMYDKPDLDQGLDKFVAGHGFTGFHITNLRDFMSNPSYFEAVVLKTYRRGGTTHFWIWGDKARNHTPETYGVDVDQLYTEIAARLAPIPGWTIGYGFDLFEWATAAELEEFRNTLHEYSSYRHLVGGRGHKNKYREISPNLDYASWEWHRPTYEDYRDHLEKSNNRPAFSEDRFRIRTPSPYPEKDYDPELTRQGLWYAAIAGGVANIWGHQPRGKEFSEPYPNQDAIKTYSTFIEKTFTVGMQPDTDLTTEGYCLRDAQNNIAICYIEHASDISINISNIQLPVQIFAVDTHIPYQEIEIPVSEEQVNWSPPQQSDWAIAIIGSEVSS